MADGAEKVQVRFNEAMIRDAVRTFVWRRFVVEQKSLWVAAATMLLLFAWLLARGDRSWLLIIAGAAVALPLLFVLVGWRAHLGASLGRLRAMPEPEAEFAFDAIGLRAVSGLGEVRLPWSSVTEVWAQSGFWMLVTAPNQFMTLPLETVPTETLGRLRGWLGAKVIDIPSPGPSRKREGS